MTYTIRFGTDVEDPTLPSGYMRNAYGQGVRVDFCCQNSADGYDCGCGEMYQEEE